MNRFIFVLLLVIDRQGFSTYLFRSLKMAAALVRIKSAIVTYLLLWPPSRGVVDPSASAKKGDPSLLYNPASCALSKIAL
jgi:hypothetical protein